MQLSWKDFKDIVDQRKIPIQWVIVVNSYWMKAFDAPFSVDCLLAINPDDPDVQDFESNYKNNGNTVAHTNVVQVLGKDSLTLCPFGAFSGNTISANQTTVWDIPLPEAMVLRGGEFFSSNATIGDWFSVQVIDKDNVLGLGGTPLSPIILGTYVIGWYVIPNVPNKLEDISISQSLPAGVYMRINYTSVGSVPPIAIMNFISYVSS